MQYLITYFLVAVVSIFSQEVIADADYNKIHLVTEDAFPLQYRQGDEIVGQATELITKIIADANLEYDLQLLPWARSYHMALSQKNTLIFSLARTIPREPLFHWIGKVANIEYYLYGFDNLAIDDATPLELLKQYRIGVVRGSAVFEYFNDLGFEHLESVVHGKQNMAKLLSNRIDLFPADSSSFQLGCINLAIDCSKIKRLRKIDVPSAALYFAMSKSSDITLVEKLKRSYQNTQNIIASK